MRDNHLSLFSFCLWLILVHAHIGGSRAHTHRKLQLSAENGIPDQYIVQFRADLHNVESKADAIVEGHDSKGDGPTISQVYSDVFPGFVVSGCSEDDLATLLDDEDVLMVSQDEYATQGALQSEPENWGLDRIDQVDLPLDDKYRYHHNGTGVYVYVLDNGIRSTHEEFNNGRSRVSCGYNAFSRTEDCESKSDHGSHVAAIVGGAKYGVAKNVNLINVKILPTSGISPWSVILGGIDYVAAQKRIHPQHPTVINLSVWGGAYRPVNDAVKAAVGAGVVVVTIAGNHDGDACRVSPASSSEAITVAATSIDDRRAYFSGYGECVDIFAPGHRIVSAVAQKGDRGTDVYQGTSMAAPHVTGAVALYLEQHPRASPQEVRKALERSASQDRVRDPQGSPNLLVSTAGSHAHVAVGTITGLTLVDAEREDDIGSIEDGHILMVADSITELTVRADSDGSVGSLVFDYLGEIAYNTEDEAPYMLARNRKRNTFPVPELVAPGMYALAATPFSESDGTGMAGETVSVTFFLVDYCIERLVLVDARFDTDIAVVSDGDVVELDLPRTRRLSMRAEACGQPGSVVFDFDDSIGYMTENETPYSMGGDLNGRYDVVPDLVAPGIYRVKVTPYELPNGNGVAGVSVEVEFELR